MAPMEKTPGQNSASDPNRTATSPSASSPTGDAATTSLVPSSAFPSAPQTTTQLIPSAPPRPTSLLPSSASQITTTQSLPSAPPLPIQETDQERISCTSDSAATTKLAGPSTAPSASSASSRTPTLLPTTDELTGSLDAVVASATEALQYLRSGDQANFQQINVGLLDKARKLLSSLDCLRDAKLMETSDYLFHLKVLSSLNEVSDMLLAEIKKQLRSSGSSGGSLGEGGGPDSVTGEGDGEGGGVGV